MDYQLISDRLNQGCDRPSYTLRCTHCGTTYAADPFRLHCEVSHSPALLRAVYPNPRLEIKPHLPGIFRYVDWLPVDQALMTTGKPITYASQGLAAHLGLDHLYISFNGYWPERHAQMLTGSFKELEADAVLARIPADHRRTLVIASAGNTGRAFAHRCAAFNRPLCLVVPAQSLDAIWLPQELEAAFKSTVRLIAVEGDYSDAIALAQIISQMEGYFPEGGVANVARRDGMGLTVLDAAVTIGRIPDHYIQAVGSGSGGIAAWEAAIRLRADGQFGSHTMKLHLAQNLPFTPLVNAWKAASPVLLPLEENTARQQIQQVSAQVLTNRHPAYSLTGGVYDALWDTQGEMYAIRNREATSARWLFEQLEGIDISAAAGVATAALIRAVTAGAVNPQDCILLNITSGGLQRLQREQSVCLPTPDWVIQPDELSPDQVARIWHSLTK
ncbi:MAG: cysteate synthase [Synechococcales bacterium]|nr:cysteate synthase [Synechococcales bacterium]